MRKSVVKHLHKPMYNYVVFTHVVTFAIYLRITNRVITILYKFYTQAYARPFLSLRSVVPKFYPQSTRLIVAITV